MPNSMLNRLRTPLLLAATVAALGLTSAPALAGTDGAPCASDSALAHASGEDCPPPPVATPVVPAPVPVQPTPAPALPRPVVKVPKAPTKKKAKKKTTKKTTKAAPKQTNVAPARVSPVVQQPTVQTPTVQTQTVESAQATIPQGGVQAGAGGMAPQPSEQLPVALAASGLLLALLALGGAMRMALVRSRR